MNNDAADTEVEIVVIDLGEIVLNQTISGGFGVNEQRTLSFTGTADQTITIMLTTVS